LPFLFESACWRTSALYPLPSSSCEGRCFLYCDENLAAIHRTVALGPIPPPLLRTTWLPFIAPSRLVPHGLTAIHRSVALGLISLVLTLLLLSLSQLPSPPSGSITATSTSFCRSVAWRGAEKNTQTSVDLDQVLSSPYASSFLEGLSYQDRFCRLFCLPP